jgi:cytochrome c peroxidase
MTVPRRFRILERPWWCSRGSKGAHFTLDAYASIGIGVDKPEPDVGRYAFTKNERDWGVFKVPTLREVEHTAPTCTTAA